MEHKPKFFDYLPVGDHELDWGLYLTVLGFNRVLPGEKFPARRHPMAYQFNPDEGRYLPEYQLIFLTQGEGTFSSEQTGTVQLTKGAVVLLFPDVWHTYRPNPSTGWEDYWIGFNGSYIYELCQRNIFSPEKPLYYPERFDELVVAFDRFLEQVRLAPMRNSMQFSAHTLEILAIATETSPDSRDGYEGKKGIVEEAVRIIWGWSYRTIHVDDIARSVAINRRTLERYFREVLQRSVHDEIVRCRLSRARRLLENTRIPIGQIAMMAGFSSLLQMRRNFMQSFHKTPEQFRRSRSKRIRE